MSLKDKKATDNTDADTPVGSIEYYVTQVHTYTIRPGTISIGAKVDTMLGELNRDGGRVTKVVINLDV